VHRGVFLSLLILKFLTTVTRVEADTPKGRVNYHFKQAKDRIDEAIKALKEAAPKGCDFRLCEIKVKDGKTELVRAPVTK